MINFIHAARNIIATVIMVIIFSDRGRGIDDASLLSLR